MLKIIFRATEDSSIVRLKPSKQFPPKINPERFKYLLDGFNIKNMTTSREYVESSVIGDYSELWLGVSVADGINIGDNCNVGIGSVVIELLKGFGMKQPLVYDPFIDQINAEKLGVKKVELQELMKYSDFITLHCPLNEHTRNLISHSELDLMKSSSFIINTARGGIINEDALFKALSEKKIAGAALDCFNDEPVLKPNRFSELDNIILAPHSIAWTQELFRDMGMMCSQNMIDLANGIRPHGVVNPEVFDRLSFQKKWENLRVQLNPTSS